MAFSLQGFGPFLHWLTLIVLCVLPLVIAYLIYRLGRLPGAIAHARNHPQADAIAVCGWMGLITLVLWPVALIWAHLAPGKPLGGGSADEADKKALIAKLYAARQRLAALEGRISQQRMAGGH